MYRIEKSFRFEAAHQLLPGCFTSACSDCIHGHSYHVTLVFESSELDKNGMVLDFGILKAFIKSIEEKWDHGVLLPKEIYEDFLRATVSVRMTQKKIVNFHVNPTAENIAESIAIMTIRFMLDEYPLVRLIKVRVRETDTGLAEWSAYR